VYAKGLDVFTVYNLICIYTCLLHETVLLNVDRHIIDHLFEMVIKEYSDLFKN